MHEDKIINIISKQLGLNPDDLRKEMDTTFAALGADSLDMVEVMNELEDNGLVIPSDKSEELVTTQSIVDYFDKE